MTDLDHDLWKYGELVITSHDDGRIEVEAAPERILIASELLANDDVHEKGALVTNRYGHLVIADQVAYRPIGFTQHGRIIICERVHPLPVCDHHQTIDLTTHGASDPVHQCVDCGCIVHPPGVPDGS